MSKNNSINFWRFIFTISIVVFHFSCTYLEFDKTFNSNVGWRLAVEFFFIVSGFLLAYKCENSDMTAWEYTKYRFKRLFPCYFLTTVVMVVFRIIEAEYNFEDSLIYIINLFDEMLMLHGTGVGYENVNGATWYVSSLLICGYFIYYLLKKNKQRFSSFIAPLSCIMIYSYIYKDMRSINGNIMEFSATLGISLALLRGFAGMCAGVICYEIYKRFKKTELTKAGIAVARIGEFAGFGIMLWYTFYYGSTKMDFIFVMFFVLCTALAFSRDKKNIIFNNKLVDYLAKISFSIYLSHIFVLRIFEYHIYTQEEYGEKMFLLYIVISIAAGAVCDFISSNAAKFLSKKSKELGGFFIKKTAERRAG